MTTRLLAGASALSFALLLVASAADATEVQFATYTNGGSGANITWTNDGLDGGTLSGTSTVEFQFINIGTFSEVPATLTFSGTTPGGNPASVFTDPLSGVTSYAQLINGSFSLIYSGGTGVYNGVTLTHGVTNLLSGTFSNAVILGSSSGVLITDSEAASALTFTSSVATVSNSSTASDFAITLNDLNPGISAIDDSHSLATFSAVSTGTFSNDPAPTLPSLPPGVVPEPAAWAMMLVGFGLVGGFARRRQGASVAA